MRLGAQERLLIRKFRRRRWVAAVSTLFAFGGMLLAVQPPIAVVQRLPSLHPAVPSTMLVLIGTALAGWMFRCPNCGRPPWTNDGFALNPRRCGACKTRLRLGRTDGVALTTILLFVSGCIWLLLQWRS